MEGITLSDLQNKYQKLATEYSKLRSQAQVLKKGVVDEQTRNTNLTELLKEYEQKVRKSDLEMESLNFRNQQLTKRIIVLQEELDKQAKQKHKGSGKHLTEATGDFFQSRNSVIDEELRSKIIENAQLLTTISDKEVIISTLEERIRNLESQTGDLRTNTDEIKENYEAEIRKLKNEISELNTKLITSHDIVKQLKIHNGETRSDVGSLGSEDITGLVSTTDNQTIELLTQAKQQIISLKQELELYKAKCQSYMNLDETIGSNIPSTFELSENSTNILGAVNNPSTLTYEDLQKKDEKTFEYFLARINDLIREKENALSICNDISLECNAMEIRLEESIVEKQDLETRLRTTEMALESLQEELSTTSHNYELQLSTMSEHLANMNETLTKQCDEIQQLEYNLALKHQRSK
ncbi:protein phosphatase 1 regulatory subunit 21-like isoform X2 [Chrysoperla carnea]|uniref:protein phosphatase 1 regulatory subunit 21-like isoform X2 n=1 Tax=Chrysoperla carnea TaxID=189513 RepID=UPI001D0915FE|nr:protein phosphatase 1 regulatory subunit 21-like isoform X2 [Chrysoperla carnea]